MNDVEQSDLARCEKVIKRTRTSFIECGNALAEIRDKRLYRQTHKNFGDYCADKWQLSRSHAYRMIDAAAQVSASPMGDKKPENERQARAQRDAARKVTTTDDGTADDASDAELEVDETSGGEPIEGPSGDGGSVSDESAGGGAPRREDGDGVSPVFTPPPPPVDTVTPSGEVPRPSDDGVDGDSHGGPRDVVTTELDASAFDAEVSVPEEGTDPVHETGVPDSVEPAAGAAASQPHPPAAGSGYGQGVALPAESKRPKLDAVGIGRSVLAAMSVGIPDNVDHLAAGIRTLPVDERDLLRDRAERARKQADLVLFTLDAMAKEEAA